MPPDHWIPTSAFIWQKNFGGFKRTLLTFFVLSSHIIFGFLIYALITLFPTSIIENNFLSFTALFLSFFMLIRFLRFSKIQTVLKNNISRKTAIILQLSLIGPAESFVPLLLKTKFLGFHLAPVIAAYIFGTIVLGFFLIKRGRKLWDVPHLLPLWIERTRRHGAFFPLTTGLAIALCTLIAITGVF